MKMDAYDAKQVETLRELDVITLEVERDQFDNWNRAALAEGLIIREWASKGLDRLAKEEFNRPLKVVAEDDQPYHSGNVTDPAQDDLDSQNEHGGDASTPSKN